jgi:ribosome assembly protein YihI (activator of Der GTPase)
MKQTKTLDYLKPHIELLKEFIDSKNQFMVDSILDRITDILVEKGYTLDEAMKFYKTNLKLRK